MQLYNPFQNFDFHFDTCFLTGQKSDQLIQKTVIHTKLQDSGNLTQNSIRLLDESWLAYSNFCLPCDAVWYEKTLLLWEENILNAFFEGYECVIQLPKVQLFQWASMLVYGFVYHELHSVRKMAVTDPEVAQIPHGLIQKFKNLHLMLQGLHLPIIFDQFEPFSIQVFKLEEKVPFSFRDDMNSLTFSMKIQDCGIVMLLQDNGYANHYLKNTLDKLQDKTLSVLQFEEVCAQFYYAAYLMNKLPEYDVLPTPEAIYLDARPMAGLGNKAVFDSWQNKVYAQVLENFWKPWGYTLFEILKNPEQPMSFIS